MGPSPGHRWATAIGLAAALVAALAARAAWVAERSVWFDEAYTWRMGLNTDRQILDRLRFDNNPPLYYLAQKYWSAVVGDSPAALRSLSVVSGLACVVGTFLFVRALLTSPLGMRGVTRREVEWAPLLAACFVAMNPLLVRYGCEARMYALGAALAVFSAWALIRAADPDRPRSGRWLLFAVITLTFAYTHTFALVTIAVEAAVVGWWIMESGGGSVRRAVRHPSFLHAAGAFGLLAAGFSPWVPTLLAQLGFSETREWIPPLTTYKDSFTLAFKFFIDPERPPGEFGPVRTGVVLGAVVLGAAWRGRWADGVLLALGVGPVLGAVGLCLTGTQVFLARYFVFGVPFLLALLAVAVARLGHPATFALAAVTAVGVHGYWSHDMWRRAAVPEYLGYRGAAEHVMRHGGPSDFVVCGDGRTYFSTRYHLRGWADVYAVYPATGTVYGGAAVPDTGREFVPLDQLVARAGKRVWVVNQEWGGALVNPVSAPVRWREVSRRAFREVFGMETVVLVEYAVP